MDRKRQRAQAQLTLLVKMLAALQIVFFGLVWVMFGASLTQWPYSAGLIIQVAAMIATVWYGAYLSKR